MTSCTGLNTDFLILLFAMQGRFWEEQFESLQVPSASKSKFAFEDGNPRVRLPQDAELASTALLCAMTL